MAQVLDWREFKSHIIICFHLRSCGLGGATVSRRHVRRRRRLRQICDQTLPAVSIPGSPSERYCSAASSFHSWLPTLMTILQIMLCPQIMPPSSRLQETRCHYLRSPSALLFSSLHFYCCCCCCCCCNWSGPSMSANTADVAEPTAATAAAAATPNHQLPLRTASPNEHVFGSTTPAPAPAPEHAPHHFELMLPPVFCAMLSANRSA